VGIIKKDDFSLATKAQRHKAAQRQLSEPWCPGAFVAKVILATKAQRHEVAQSNILVNLSALVSSWRIHFLATKSQRHEAAQRQLSVPWCLCGETQSSVLKEKIIKKDDSPHPLISFFCTLVV
jgi:hypothetical protein